MQNQNQGSGQSQSSQGQNQNMDWQSPNSGGKMQDTQTPAGQNAENVRPEVENPQPVRKEEEPITSERSQEAGKEYNQDNDNRNVANTGTTAGTTDYSESNIGFRQDTDRSDLKKGDKMRNESDDQTPSMADSNREWREQQMGSKG